MEGISNSSTKLLSDFHLDIRSAIRSIPPVPHSSEMSIRNLLEYYFLSQNILQMNQQMMASMNPQRSPKLTSQPELNALLRKN